MNILLVDDDRYIIQALQEKIDWNELDVSHVFSAYNMTQAQEIIHKHPIDLLISDIEMPKGSGLQLLSWIRQENYTIQAIFLTNYADFNYAQKAIELQSFEYYLKPIEFDKLTLIIKKVLLKIKRDQQHSENFKLFETNFWYDHLRKIHPEKKIDFLQEATSKNIQLHDNEQLLPIIITLDLLEKDLAAPATSWRKQLSREIDALLFDHLQSLTFFKLDEYVDKYFLLLKIKRNHFSNRDLFILHAKLSKRLQIDIQFVIGKPSQLTTITHHTDAIYRFIQTCCGTNSGLYFLSQTYLKLPEYQNLSTLFKKDLIRSSETEVAELIKNTLLFYRKEQLISMDVLKSLRLDLVQTIDIHLGQKGILAHKLFQNTQHDILVRRNYNSIDSFARYMTYYVQTANEYVRFLDSQQSVSQVLLDYIDQHYTEEINRKDLAEIVFLSPDYLAKIFKKETGYTLINYITHKRITRSKELLLETDTAVYLIASQVGYDNYSYFTKTFKKLTGISPNDFRSKQNEASQ